jgi:hypothetical protein
MPNITKSRKPLGATTSTAKRGNLVQVRRIAKAVREGKL